MIRFSLLAITCLVFCSDIAAHHSSSHFSSEVTELQGTLVELRWRNPHIHFILETQEADGKTKRWELEAGTIYMIGRAGVTRDMFTVGETIRVAGNRSERYEDKFWVENILTTDGREISVVAAGRPYFKDELIGGRSQWTNEAFIKNGPSVDGEGIFRVWSPATRDYRTRLKGDPETDLDDIATDAARAAGASWDPYEFDARCDVPGLPEVNFGPHPHQFIKDGDNILLISEEYYVTRTIHMNSEVDPTTVPRSHLGFSVGRWEDDNTLIVETSRINYPYMNLGGIGQSENVTLYERYVVNAEENRLDTELIIRDPGMITEPLIERSVYLDLGETIDESYDCVPQDVS